MKCSSFTIVFENYYKMIRCFQITHPNDIPSSRESSNECETMLLDTGSVSMKYHRFYNTENEEIPCSTILKSLNKLDSFSKVASSTKTSKSSVKKYAKKRRKKIHLVHRLL